MVLYPITDLLKRIVVALPDYAGEGGGNIKSINILDGVHLNPGYIDASGRPAAQTANNEYYTDPIDVTPYLGKDIVLGVLTKNAAQQWLGRTFYDENGTFVNRDAIQYVDGTKLCGMFYKFSVPSSGVKTMVLAWRALTGCVYFAGVYEEGTFTGLADAGFGAV